jgi:hypothetical protein
MWPIIDPCHAPVSTLTAYPTQTGLFYFTLFRSEAGKTKWFALALAIYGVAVMVFW